MPPRKKITKAVKAVEQAIRTVTKETVAVTAPVIQKNRRSVWHKIVATVFIVIAVVAMVVGGLMVYQTVYAQKVYPGVGMDGVKLVGLTKEKTAATLRDAWDAFSKQGIPLEVNGQTVTLTRFISSPADPDLTYELFQLSPDQASEEAYAVGRTGSWLEQLIEPVIVAVFGKVIKPVVNVDLERVTQFIRDTVPGIEQEPHPAAIVVDLAGNVQVQPEQSGVLIAADKLEQDLMVRAVSFSHEPVTVSVRNVSPSLTEQKLATLLPEARQVITEGKALKFVFGDRTWTVEPEVWRTWLGARENESVVQLGFTTQAADEYFAKLASEVNQPARDAKFEIKDGRVTAFVASQSGQEMDVPAAVRAAETATITGQTESVSLVVVVTEPKVLTAEVNDLGITELIGVGTSNFAGSPKNRRHNIKVGADSLNGLLVKPDETFSLLKALGEIDATTGYLPELVIKGNKTIPEYGGGLCQIGTTTFRVALGSGLPIVERRNHSYRVVYYEPAGTDATIYSPAPDFKFKNDTGYTVLIQTKIDGDNLIFEFWGTKDGRKIEQTKSRIFNITAPAQAKIIETEDLEPGVKKCTEKAHNGADAEFTYTVTYADGQVEEQVFKSHYIPWQEVCLLGVPKGTLEQMTDDGTTDGTETPPVPAAVQPGT